MGGFLGGLAVGLAAHESGHLLFDVIFDADPASGASSTTASRSSPLRTSRDCRRRQEFVISSAGFWVQHATNEWLLTRRPNLRSEGSAFTKGVFAFNVRRVGDYAGGGVREDRTAGARHARDGASARVDERWIGR